jgi:hypothetical protein
LSAQAGWQWSVAEIFRGGPGRSIMPSVALERDGFKLYRHRALDLWWSMIFSENRFPLFRIVL